MNYKIVQLVILALAALPLTAQACPPSSNPNNDFSYMRRDGDRCEGLFDRTASSMTDLVSLSTGSSQLNGYPNILNIRIPSNDNTRLTIGIQSDFINYRLDNLLTLPSAKGFTFKLNTRILTHFKVPSSTLQARAYIQRDSDSHRVYLPVILGQPTGQYEFVVKSIKRVTLTTFGIFRNGQPFYNPKQKSEIPKLTHPLIWQYGSAPQGLYQLRIIDNQAIPWFYYFEHNPNLL
jgi:hypothetical protein